MANVAYRQVPNTSGDWFNQANPGGPSYFQVRFSSDDNAFFVYFTWNGDVWFKDGNPFPTAANAQTALNNYVGKLNAGTA